MGSHDPAERRLANAHATQVHDLGPGAEPHLPTGGTGAGAPVDRLPVEGELLVLEPDLGDGGSLDRVAGLGAVPDHTLAVMRPAVPPEAALARRRSSPARCLTPEQGIPQTGQVAGARLQRAIRV